MSFTLYLYHDFCDYYNKNYQQNLATASMYLLLQRLAILISSQENIVILEKENQIEVLAQKVKDSDFFDITLAIGDSGESIASMVHKKAHLFPQIKKLAITRNEIEPMIYVIVDGSTAIINGIDFEKVKNIAIVDDTIYSGKTLLAVLKNIPQQYHKKISIFCSQAMTDSLAQFSNVNKIICATQMNGVVEKDVSIIKASGLFEKGAIKRKNLPPLSFIERPSWIHRWFPLEAKNVIALCEKIQEIQKGMYENSFSSTR